MQLSHSLRPSPAAAGRSSASTSQPAVARRSRSAPTATVGFLLKNRLAARSYDVDVEPPPRAPSSAPGRWGGPSPPPPPPPPPQSNMAPNRREALFAFVGGLLGAGGVATYYNTQYDMSTDAAEAALDQILDDPAFLEAIAEEALFKDFSDDMDETEKDLDSELELEQSIDELTRQLEEVTKEVDNVNAAAVADGK